MWDAMAAWEAAKDAGMLFEVQVMRAGAAHLDPVWVKWHQPDVIIGMVQSSRQYLMEYRTQDLPDLAEADQVQKGESLYKVREPPHVPEVKDRGEFMRALLTKQD